MFQMFFIHFPDLRKQARQLENEIDSKLVSFSKLGMAPTPFNPTPKSSETVHLLGDGLAFESVSSELQQLLAKVSN